MKAQTVKKHFFLQYFITLFEAKTYIDIREGRNVNAIMEKKIKEQTN